MEPTNNLIVINDSGFAKGGATSLAIESAIGASKSGWKVTFISRKNPNPDPRLMESGVRLIEIEGKRVSNTNPKDAITSGLWNKNSLKTLENEFENQDLSNTVFHVHNWAHFLSPSIFAFFSKNQSRTVFTAHDYFLTCGNGGQFNFPKNEICDLKCMSVKCLATQCDKKSRARKMWRLTRHSLRERTLPAKSFSGTIALIHKKQSKYFEQAGFAPERITTIGNPIMPLSRDRVCAEKNDSILFIGRIDVDKGAYVAAKAATLANVKIVFAGEGPLRPQIEKEFPNADFQGFCERDHLSELIKKSRMVIMPSLLEPFGLAAVESLWSGVPVLISKNAVLAEEIVGMNAGVEINPNSIDQVVTTLKVMMKDDEKVKRMSYNGFERCKTIANTKEQWLKEYDQLYRQMLTA